MCIERIIRFFAGTLVLLSIVLARAVNPWFYLLTAFVGVNLLQSGLTNWCLLVSILRRLGVGDCSNPRTHAHG